MTDTGPCECGHGANQSVHQLLCELFDAQISPARAAAIRDAVAQCPECFSRLESEQAVRGLVRKCCETEHAPEPLRQRIITSITSVTYTEVRRYQ